MGKVKEMGMASATIEARRDWEDYGYPQYANGTTEWLDEYHEEFKRLTDEAIKIDEESWNAKG